MKANNQVVFHRDVANAIDGICTDVREKFTAGDGCDIKSIADDVVTFSPSWTRHVLQLVFEDIDAVVRHVVRRLEVEGDIMKAPPQIGKAILCFRLAIGYSHEELARNSGFAEFTIQETARLHAGFISYIEDQMKRGIVERNKMWHLLEDLWAKWIDGRLLD